MKKEEILKAIETLAKSQGFYTRLYETLKEDPSYLKYLEDKNFKDVVDMVLYFEG